MLKRLHVALLIAGLVAATALTFGLICIGIAALQVRKTASTASGMLTDVSRLIEDANGAANEARHASEEQRAFLNALDPKLLATIAKANTDLDQFKTLMVTAQGTLSATTDTVAGIKPVLAAAQASIADLQPLEAQLTTTAAAVQLPLEKTTQMLQDASVLLHNASALISNPQIPLTLTNIQGATANLDHTTATLDAFATRITKPASAIKEFIYHVIGWTASAGSWR